MRATSLSMMVSTAVLCAPSTALPVGLLRVRFTVSSPSTRASSMTGIMKVLSPVSPSAKVMAPDVAVYSEPAVVVHLQQIEDKDWTGEPELKYWPTNALQADRVTWDMQFALVQTDDATPPAVTVLIPNGGEYWEGGSSYDVTWTATDDQTPADQLVIAIDYSTEGGSTWNNIASGEANDGAYTWVVPNTIDTQDALVSVSAPHLAGNVGSDDSDVIFTIDSTVPAVTVLYPTLNEIWFIGYTYEIKWIASDNFTPSNEPYNIVEFCNDGRPSTPTIWVKICERYLTDVSGDGSCTWKVDAYPFNYCLIRVSARDLSGTNIGIGGSDYFCPVEPGGRFQSA